MQVPLFIKSADSDKSRLCSIASNGRLDSCSYQGFFLAVLRFSRFVRQLHHNSHRVAFSLYTTGKPFQSCLNVLFGGCGTKIYNIWTGLKSIGARIGTFRGQLCVTTQSFISVQALSSRMTEYLVEMVQYSFSCDSICTSSFIIFAQLFIHTMRTSFLGSEPRRT